MSVFRDFLLHKPTLFLAPMDDVTDLPFRFICKQMGAEVTISEFISSDALIRDVEKSKNKMKTFKGEYPFGIQIFGNTKESMCEAAKIALLQTPDFIDINWGCPVKKIAGKGSGSGMLQNIALLVEITKAVVDSVNIPVTVKTRLGYNDENKIIVDLAERLQDVGISAITIHGRTKTQMYKGTADWTLIGETKANPRLKIPVIGNGDIVSPAQALEVYQKYGVDGIMIGRGAIGNPWLFQACRKMLYTNEIMPEISIAERVDVCKKHFLFSMEQKGEHKGILEMRKHYKSYFKAIPDFKSYKLQLLTLTDRDEILNLFSKINEYYG